MNFNWGSLLNTEKPQAVRIKTRRSMMLKPLDGETLHVEKGHELTISAETAAQLEKTDYELIDSGRKPVEVTDPTPQRQEPRPLPDRWSELPGCYADYWTITEEIRCARQHVSEIIEARIQFFGSNFTIGKNGGGKALVGGMMSVNPRMPHGGGLVSTLQSYDLDDPALRKIDRLLTIAEDTARDHYKRLIDTKEISLQRAFLACGQHRLKVADELREVLEELASIGFELFSIRTAALGLAEFQIRRLFTGSADYQKYSDHAPAIAHGVSSAGLDASGQMIPYSDIPVQSQATWSLTMAARLAELRPLLADGRKELAKARKASAAAA